MKRFRPFLALLLACWLLAVPALAVDEAGGAPDDAPPVSDDAPGDTSSPEPEAPAPDGDTSEEAPAPPEDSAPPPEEDAPPPADDTPASSDNAQSFPDDTPSSSEDTPPVVEDTPPGEDSVPVDPPADIPVEVPDTPTDPPVAETPAEVPPVSSDIPVTVLDPLPVYPVPDASAVVPGLQDVPADTLNTITADTPAAQAPQVFTITTIPEFALAAIEPDADNTMSQAVRALFGTYTPRVQTVTTYYNGEQIAIEEQYVPGVAGLDWEWLGGFAVFCIMLYCLFRLLGGSVKYG